jgi:predicted PurR-regulated permease PerM
MGDKKKISQAVYSVNSGPVMQMAGIIIIIAGVRAFADFITPLLLAIFISIIGAYPMEWLERKRVPHILAITIVLISMLVILTLLGGVTGTSIASFTQDLPHYEQKLRSLEMEGLRAMDAFGFDFSEDKILDSFDSGKILSFTATLLNSLGSLMSTSALILLTVLFILLESKSFPRKISLISSNPTATRAKMKKVVSGVRHYLSIKTLTSLGTGVLVSVWLMILGVDYPVLWGLIAFLMNYIPNIGSLLAAIPAILLALVQLGPSSAFWVGVGYLVINTIIGSIIEPKVMGKGLGMSTLVVFISLILWGWVLGAVGMFLSVPLTMIAKIYFEANESTKWIAIILGTEENTSSAYDYLKQFNMKKLT